MFTRYDLSVWYLYLKGGLFSFRITQRSETTRMGLQLSDMWFLGHRVGSTAFQNLEMSDGHVFTQAKKSAVWKSPGKLESLPFKWLWHGCLGHFVNNVVPPTVLPDFRAFSFFTPFPAVRRAYSQSVTFKITSGSNQSYQALCLQAYDRKQIIYNSYIYRYSSAVFANINWQHKLGVVMHSRRNTRSRRPSLPPQK